MMLTKEATIALAQKEEAARRLAFSVACLKLELPEQVWQDHYDAIQAYLNAERGVSDITQGLITTLETKLEALGWPFNREAASL